MRHIRVSVPALLTALLVALLCPAHALAAQAPTDLWSIDFSQVSMAPGQDPLFPSAHMQVQGDQVVIDLVTGAAFPYAGGRWSGTAEYVEARGVWVVYVDLGGGLPHNLMVFEISDLNNPAYVGLRVELCNGVPGNRSCDNSIPLAADPSSYSAVPTLEPVDEQPVDTTAEGPIAVGCDTYCLNGVSVDSPFCDCAAAEPDDDDGGLGVLIGILVALGVIGAGSALAKKYLGRKPKPKPQAPEPPAERALVDALGRTHTYMRDEQGRYINPETGGELDEAQWAEFNRNLVANQEFIERERQKQSARDTAFDREMDQLVEAQKQRERDLHAVQQMTQSLLFNPDGAGLWRGPGGPGDIYTNLKELREQLTSGEGVDRRKLDAVRRLYRDHCKGAVLAEEEIPSDMDQARDVLTGTIEGTLREAITGQDSEGGTSWKGMGLRLLANLATAGQVELLLTPIESLYTMHGYVEQGGDSALKGFLSTAANIVVGELFSWAGEAGARRLFGGVKAKPQLPRSPKPRAGSPARYVNAGVDMHPHLAGMPDANIRHAQRVAQKNNVQILVRPTNPEARALLEKKLACPKPMMIKNKTITHLDTYLGAAGDDLGKVGHFKPTLPPKAKVPPELYDKVKKRYVQRLNEFRDQAEHVRQLQAHHEVVEHNGVLYEALEDGTRGKPYCGDHDLFEILDANGNPCPESLKQHVLKELKQPPFEAKHGALMDWDYSHYSPTPGPGGAQSAREIAKGIDQAIREAHAPGGEPLINFGPGTQNPISGRYYVGG